MDTHHFSRENRALSPSPRGSSGGQAVSPELLAFARQLLGGEVELRGELLRSAVNAMGCAWAKPLRGGGFSGHGSDRGEPCGDLWVNSHMVIKWWI